MKILVFDISADFAYFKVPEGTRSNFSYPFPPRTTVIGLIAAITGKMRNKYWNNSSFSDMKIGVQINTKSFTYGIKMNYWRSKTVASIGGRSLKMKMILGGSDTKRRGYTTQVKLDYLTNASYRIFIHTSDELLEELNRRIKGHKYYYPPYLGHANLLAELSYVGLFDAEEIDDGNYCSIVPNHTIKQDTDLSDSLSYGGFSLYNSVPNSYRTEENHVNEDIESYISIPDNYVNIFVPEVTEELPFKLKEGYGYRVQLDNENVDVCLF